MKIKGIDMLQFLRAIYRFFGLVTSCCLFFYYVGTYAYTVNLELDAIEYYRLFPVCLAAFLLVLTLNVFLARHDFSDFKVAYILLICLLSLAYVLDLSIFSWANEHAFNVFCVVIAGYMFTFHVSRRQLAVFLVFVNVLTFALIAKAYAQAFSYHGPLPLSLAVTSYFDNSGLLAVYLVVTFPLLIHVFVRGIGKLRGRNCMMIAYVFLTLLVGGVLLITLSRTALLCFLFITAIVLAVWFQRSIVWFVRSYRLYFWVITVGCIFVVGAGFLYLYNFKYQSAEGRRLIWNICLSNVGSHPMVGTGLGTFSAKYPIWQAAYFQQHPNVPASYFLSAGETVNAFNEYIQMLCECGTIGLLLFVIILFATLITHYGHLGVRMTTSLKLTMIAIMVSSFSFYTLHCTAILYLVLIISLKLLYHPARDGSTFFTSSIRIPAFLFISILILVAIAKGRERYTKIQYFEVVCNRHDLSPAELIKVEDSTYPILQTDGKFLTRLGLMMWEYGNTEKAIMYLSKSLDFYCGYENRYQLAKCYAVRGEYRNALEQFRFLSYYIPSKFVPNYERFKIYRSMGLQREAKDIGHYVLDMPVKKPSPLVEDIKREIMLYLNAENRR